MKENQKRSIRALIEDCCERGVFPGANTAVITEDDEYLFTSGKKALFAKEEANSIETIYDIASLTKVVVTTTLIMKLIEEGKLSLNTKVEEVLSKFTNEDIDILQLLTHTSGLPADIAIDLRANKEVIRNKIYECNFKIGEKKKVVYSDIGFIILGFIAEEILKQPLKEAAKNLVFDPLRMTHTCYLPDKALAEQCAPTEDSPHFHKILRGEVHDRKAYLMGGVSGHAGLFSTIEDMCRFSRMLLNDGLHDGKKILEKGSIERMFTRVTEKEELGRALGYLTFDERSPFSTLNSRISILHTGFTGTSILIDKENKISIILLSNRVHPTRENTKIIGERKKIHEGIMNILKG